VAVAAVRTVDRGRVEQQTPETVAAVVVLATSQGAAAVLVL
jgi:hypothetical protein